MASGFIYLIILGMWAAYFLPKWIASHEESSGKSQERYRSAMRIVSETGIGAPIADTAATISREEKHRQVAQRRIISDQSLRLYCSHLHWSQVDLFRRPSC